MTIYTNKLGHLLGIQVRTSNYVTIQRNVAKNLYELKQNIVLYTSTKNQFCKIYIGFCSNQQITRISFEVMQSCWQRISVKENGIPRFLFSMCSTYVIQFFFSFWTLPTFSSTLCPPRQTNENFQGLFQSVW